MSMEHGRSERRSLERGGPQRRVIDGNFLASKLERSEGKGYVRLVQAFSEKMPEATPDEAFRAADVVASKVADLMEQSWTLGAGKQHGSGIRFRIFDVKVEDESGADG